MRMMVDDSDGNDWASMNDQKMSLRVDTGMKRIDRSCFCFVGAGAILKGHPGILVRSPLPDDWLTIPAEDIIQVESKPSLNKPITTSSALSRDHDHWNVRYPRERMVRSE
jgi:hypothetical protein